MKYIALLREPYIRWPLLFAFIGRIPLYVVNLALVLWAVKGGSYVISGLLVGVFNVGGAIGGVVTAGMADHKGASRTLAVTGVVQCVCLVLLGTVGLRAVALAMVLVFAAGFATPPISSVIRNYWSSLPEAHVDPAYAVESVVGELLSIVGPLVLSAVLVFSDSAQALVVSGFLVLIGSVLLGMTNGIREFTVPREGSEGTAKRTLHDTLVQSLRMFRNKGFTGLVVRRMLEAVSNGAFDVAIPAFAIWLGSEVYSGSLYSALGVGSILGGLVYGLRKWRMPKEQIYCWGLLLSAIGMALPLLAFNYLSMSVALAIGALSFAPVVAVEYSLISRTSSVSHRSQGFAWMTTAGVAGSAIGSQAAGIVTTYWGWRATFGVAAAVAFIAALLAWPMRRYWKEAKGQTDESSIG